jgi:DNA polymerase-3 subunit gamma/tau
MLTHNRIPHAFLFSGPRGTGKTTMAKILAKAVNCREGVTATPCQVCSSCVDVTQNTSIDVIEIDAASNRGIDEIRQLREQVKFAPAESRYKVYIIDEVHMLTTEAFNALLKTLEEPPSHVIFVLATTEPHKLPLTIISRCQRFDFRRLDSRIIQSRLLQVAEAKGIDISPDAALHIAQLAEGGMRDALGMLEQCMSYGEGKVTREVVEQVTGSVPIDVFLEVLRVMSEGQEGEALIVLARELDGGREPNQLLSSYLQALRRFLLATHSPVLLREAGFEEATVERMAQTARSLRLALPELLNQALNTESEMRYGGHPRLHLELLLVQQMATIQAHGGGAAVVTAPKEETIKPPVVKVEHQPAPSRQPEELPSGPQVASLLKIWPEVIAVIRKKAPLTASTLGVVSPQRIEGDTVVLYMTENNAHTYKRLQGDLEHIRAGLSIVLGREVQVKLTMSNGENREVERDVDQVKEALDIFKGRIVKE